MKGFLGGGSWGPTCVCVLQQGAAWPYSLMALTFIVCCGILKWAEAAGVRPAGFGALWRWNCYPRRFESVLPEVKLVPSAVRRRSCWLLTVTVNGRELLQGHTCSFLFFFLFFFYQKTLFKYAAFRSLLDWEWIRVRPFSHHPCWC